MRRGLAVRAITVVALDFDNGFGHCTRLIRRDETKRLAEPKGLLGCRRDTKPPPTVTL